MSVDGHTGNWSFSATRLNMHVVKLAAKAGGCIIVDATRKGKRFPDSFSKTLPSWACVLNRAIGDARDASYQCMREGAISAAKARGDFAELMSTDEGDIIENASDFSSISQWDCELHFPLFVPKSEQAEVAKRIPQWVETLKSVTSEHTELTGVLRKPLRPLWVSQRTVMWLNEMPDPQDWPFTPLILLSVSQPSSVPRRHTIKMTNSNGNSTDETHSWTYVPGAADDEESWARGLSPELFWQHCDVILAAGPEGCVKVANSLVNGTYHQSGGVSLSASLNDHNHSDSVYDTNEDGRPSYGLIADTGLAIGTGELRSVAAQFDALLTAGSAKLAASAARSGIANRLHLNVVGVKVDKFSLQAHLPAALNFVRSVLDSRHRLLVVSDDGCDASACIGTAILLSFFDGSGRLLPFGVQPESIDKAALKQRLAVVTSHAPHAHASRGMLRQVLQHFTEPWTPSKENESEKAGIG
eukprot:jgi/Chlat1/6427/Chrsp45S05949